MGAEQVADLVKGGNMRVFIQKEGISPRNPYLYYGCLMLDGANQGLGEEDLVTCPSSEQPNRWDIVDTVPKQQELGTTDFTQHMSKDLSDVFWELKRRKCRFHAQLLINTCSVPDNFNDWEAKILLENTRLTAFNLANSINPLSGEDNAIVDITGTLQFREIERLTKLRFQEYSENVLLAEALDVLYRDNLQCGDCGVPSDGCRKLYTLTVANAGSPGLSGQVVVTTDDKSTFFTIDIPTLGGLSPNRFAAVGNKLVVVSEAKRSHHWSLFSNIDAQVVSWSEVQTGYVAGKGPRAIYSKSASETFVAGAGGYLYLMTDPTKAVSVLSDGTLTTQNLNDIHGFGRVVVAVGGSNVVLLSTNRGKTFSLLTGPAVGVALNAVWAINEFVFFVGAGDGRLFYTENQGTTWTQITFDANVNVINDFWFFKDTVGYMAAQRGASGAIFATTDGGSSWSDLAPRLTGTPTAERYNAVSGCGYNEIAVAGRSSPGGDGVLAVAE